MSMNIDFTERITEDFAAIGVAPPAELVALDELLALLRSRIAADPHAEIHEEIRGGKLRASTFEKRLSDAALARVLQREAQAQHDDLEPTIGRQRRKFLHDSGDSIVASLRAPFDEAVAKLAGTLENLAPDADVTTVANVGPSGVAAWEERGKAVAVLDAVKAIYALLVDPCNYGATWNGRRLVSRRAVNVALFVAEARDAADLERAEALRREGWAHLVAAGFELRLNLVSEAERVEQGAHAVSEQAEAEARAATDDVDRHRSERTAEAWKGFAESAGRAMS